MPSKYCITQILVGENFGEINIICHYFAQITKVAIVKPNCSCQNSEMIDSPKFYFTIILGYTVLYNLMIAV